MFYTFILIGIFLGGVSAGGGGSSTRGKWEVTDPNSGLPCITFWGQIDLELSYYEDGTESEKDGHLTVPAASPVNKQSSCAVVLTYGLSQVNAQVLQLDFDHMPGWSMQLIFSTDKRFQTNGNEWALIQVTVTANYTALPSQFPNPAEPGHFYKSPVNLGGTTDLADYIYAHLSDSYYCPSQQKYIINNDQKVGPKATMTLSLLQVQAYSKVYYPGLVPFGNKETCPTDQHVTDKVPLIVGGVLAGLVILTMVTYLIYRACLPDEIINLVNPNSHHENKAMTWDEEEGGSNHDSQDSHH